MEANDQQIWREDIPPEAAIAVASTIAELAEFPVLDATVQRILTLCDDPETSAGDLVDALEQDPTFAANILHYANCAARAQPIRAKSIRQAVMLVGRRALRRLAVEAATYRFFERAAGAGGASFGQLHVHAITVANAAAAAATEARLPSDAVHLAGLLHDVGRIVLPAAFGDAACDEIAASTPTGWARARAERAAFGIDHAQAGALLADAWKIDPGVVSVLAWHHGGSTGIAVPDVATACVQVGDALSTMVHGDEPDHALLEVALDRLGLPLDILDTLADQVVGAEHRGAVGRLADRLGELDSAIETDETTGVSSRRYWLSKVRQALAGLGATTVMVVDVANFDDIRDRHGERVADVLLTEVGSLIGRHGHAGRLDAARFGLHLAGDEEQARRVAATIVDAVGAALDPGSPLTVEITTGIAAATARGGDLAELLCIAEDSLGEIRTESASAAESTQAVGGLELRAADPFAV